MTINKKQCNKGNYGGVRSTTKYLVIHYTSNKGDTAKNNADYFAREVVKASAHFFVDENSVWNSVPENCVAWHCGASSYKHPYCRNSNSLGIEICMNAKDGSVRKGSIETAITLAKELMKKYNIPLENVIRHHDVTGKYCPGPMVDDISLWNDFKNRLKEDDKVVIKTSVDIDGKTYSVNAINKDDTNYIKLRDLEQAGYSVSYDSSRQIPVVKNPFVKSEIALTDEDEQAIATLKQKAGLEDSTIQYLLNYTYGRELISKLASM